MTINKLRRFLYTLARGLGDVQAVRRGRVVQHIQNRIIYRSWNRLLRKLLK